MTMKKKLYYSYGESMEDLFQRIDSCGGWPLNKPFLGVKSDPKAKTDSHLPVYFSNVAFHDESKWTLYNSDNYHWWKMSASGKAALKRVHFEQLKRLIQQL